MVTVCPVLSILLLTAILVEITRVDAAVALPDVPEVAVAPLPRVVRPAVPAVVLAVSPALDLPVVSVGFEVGSAVGVTPATPGMRAPAATMPAASVPPAAWVPLSGIDRPALDGNRGCVVCPVVMATAAGACRLAVHSRTGGTARGGLAAWPGLAGSISTPGRVLAMLELGSRVIIVALLLRVRVVQSL